MIWVNLVFVIAVSFSALRGWRAVVAGRRALPVTSSVPIASWQQPARWNLSRTNVTMGLALAAHACSLLTIAAFLIAAVNRATGNPLSLGYRAPGAEWIATVLGVNDLHLARLSLWAAVPSGLIAGWTVGAIAAFALATLFGPPTRMSVSADGVSVGNALLPWAFVGATRAEPSRRHLLLFSIDDARMLLVTLAPPTVDLFEQLQGAITGYTSAQRAEVPVSTSPDRGRALLPLLAAIIAFTLVAVVAYRFGTEAVWFLYGVEILGLSVLGRSIFGKWSGRYFRRVQE
jgi:hypothetical protein